MIHFTPIRTRRLNVRLREIPIGAAVKLCGMTPERAELTATEFLRFAIEEAKAANDQQVTDPRAWTVQERMWAVVSYLCVTSDGDVDLKIDENAKLSDYYLGGIDYPAKLPIELGTVAGTRWTMKPLLGAEAEAIEEFKAVRQSQTGRFHWAVCAMAAQLRKPGETAPDAINDYVGFCQWLRKRAEELEALPESEFAGLMAAFWTGQDQLAHFFRIGFDDAGVVALPAKEGRADLRPARFPADSCVTDFAKRLAGKSRSSGG